MPHKRDPVLSKSITGLCRVLHSFITPTLENVVLWHERDISRSSVRRFILPDTFITADFMLVCLINLIEKLLIYSQNMMKNLNPAGGLVLSQRMLLELSFRGLSHKETYKIVQRNVMRVWKGLQEGKSVLNEKNESLFLLALFDNEGLKAKSNEKSICKYFDHAYYTKNIGSIFDRVFK